MSHETWFNTWLRRIETRPPRDFLVALGPTHVQWHGYAEAERPIGFLTFHKEVVAAFRTSLRGAGWEQRFPPPWDEPPPFAYDPRLDDVTDPRQFSRAIERWHNRIHNSWSEPGFHDPARTIYLRSFWSFHRLIDLKFDACLSRANLTFASLDPALHRVV